MKWPMGRVWVGAIMDRDVKAFEKILQLLNALDFQTTAFWTVIVIVVLWFTYRVLKFLFKPISKRLTRWSSPFFHAAERRKIFKACKSLKGSVETLKKELEAYKAALEALIKADLTDNARLSKTVEDFKIAAGGLTLSELPIGKFVEVSDQIWIHEDESVYFKIVWIAERLEAFNPGYKRFFVKVNGEYVEDIEALVASQYHVTQIKPGTDFLMQKNTIRDAERAVRYFSSYMQFVDTAVENANNLLDKLSEAEKQNKYFKLLMQMD
jgi:hypothetical protein